MQRVDHPDPAKANVQALQDLENGATGLTLVMAGSVSANGYGLDAAPATLARVLDGVQLDAGITIDFNLSPPTRAAVQHFAALVKSRKLAPASVDMRASIDPIGGFAAIGDAARNRGASCRKASPAMVGELAMQGFRGPFAVADGRIIHNAGGSEAQELAFAIASGVEYLRALESQRYRARCRARHDLFPAIRRRRRIPDDRQVSRAAKTVGARRAGLRARRRSRPMSRRKPLGA